MPREEPGLREAAPRNLAAFNLDFEDTDRGGLLDLPPARAERPTVDLGAVTDKVVASLAGRVPRERVEQLLVELLEQEFSAARVTLFLPIFLHRLACETLRQEGAAGGVAGTAGGRVRR
jgi:hypothetical protein